MADDFKISALPAGTELADTDEFPFVDKSDTSTQVTGKTKRAVWSTIKTALGDVFAALVHSHAQSDVTNLTADLAGKETAGAASAAIATHVGQSDPHAQYALESALGGAASLNVGTTAGTVAAGDHTHTGLSVQAAGTPSVRALGTSGTEACAGNDSRLSDARTPTAHTHPLSQITQSSATTGQVAQWNGSAWVPASVNSPFTKDLDADAFIQPSSNYPSRTVLQDGSFLQFDDTTVESAISRRFTVDSRYTGNGTLKADVFYCMASATSGNVEWRAYVEAVTPGDALDLDSASSFDSANSGSAAVPGTAGYMQKITITLTNKDGVVAGDLARIKIDRNTSTSGDATGDARLILVRIYEE